MSTTDHPADDQAVVALFLLSVASRPLPLEFEDADYFQLDRAELWKLASAANIPLGRNTFHATVAALAEETDAVTVDRFVGSNRRFVRLGVPESDEYGWLNEILADQEFDELSAALDAAAARGFDTETPLPAELVLPVSRGAGEVWDDDEDDEDAPELAEKPCTKCGGLQPFDEFPLRSTGKYSSWCRTCHRAATADWRRRHPGRARLVEDGSSARYADRPWDEVVAAMPEKKRCGRCRQELHATAFNYDRHRPDGLAARCKACRGEDRVFYGVYEHTGARSGGAFFGPA